MTHRVDFDVGFLIVAPAVRQTLWKEKSSSMRDDSGCRISLAFGRAMCIHLSSGRRKKLIAYQGITNKIVNEYDEFSIVAFSIILTIFTLKRQKPICQEPIFEERRKNKHLLLNYYE